MNLLPKPLTQPWMSQEEIKFREEIDKELLKLKDNEFFDEPTFKLEGFFDNGIGSVVCKISDKNGTYGVKTALNLNSILIESEFYKSWEQNGVNVVKVLKTIAPTTDHPFAIEILEYIGGGRTSAELSKLNIEKLDLFFQLGEQLGLMHKSKSQGYGAPTLSKVIRGVLPTFETEIQNTLNNEQITFLKSENIITDRDINLIRKCVVALSEDISNGRSPCFTHNDLGLHNTFGLDRLIIFDPVPRISHPYMDLATTILWASLTKSRAEATKQVKDGYIISSQDAIDEQVLSAAIYLRTLEKLTKWIKRSKSEDKVLYWVKRGKMLLDEVQS